MTALARLDERADAWLRAQTPWLAAVAAVLLFAPLALGLAGPGYLVATLCAAVVIAPLVWLQAARDRRVFVAVLLVAALVRLVVHPLLFAWTSAAGGPFLGPDSSTYFEQSLVLAGSGFIIDLPPALYFGTYDSAQYYLFALLITVAGPELHTLQWFNCCLTAACGAMAYALARRVHGAPAVLCGLTVALYPSLVVLGAKDLLKDPSVVLAALVTTWTWLTLMTASERLRIAAVALAGAVAMAYLRMSRPYALYFLQFALVGTAAMTWLSARRLFTRRAAALAFACAVLVAEVGPWRIGWPPSPAMFLAQVRHTAQSVGMLEYASGLLDSLAATDVSSGVRTTTDGEAGPRDRAGSPAPEPGLSMGVVRVAANGVRKLFGPFVWIAPPDWDARTIATQEYLLYPGMLVWYALLPALGVAFVVLVHRVIARRPVDRELLLLAWYIAGLGSLYLALNLSSRQRDFLFPFALVLSLTLASHLSGRAWTRLYLVYWLLLAGLASAHLALKAALA